MGRHVVNHGRQQMRHRAFLRRHGGDEIARVEPFAKNDTAPTT
jgi:hypothetical protein